MDFIIRDVVIDSNIWRLSTVFESRDVLDKVGCHNGEQYSNLDMTSAN